MAVGEVPERPDQRVVRVHVVHAVIFGKRLAELRPQRLVRDVGQPEDVHPFLPEADAEAVIVRRKMRGEIDEVHRAHRRSRGRNRQAGLAPRARMPGFFETLHQVWYPYPMVRGGEDTVRVVNRTRGIVLGDKVRTASGFLSRFVGLLGTASIADGEGLWIVPCRSVHTLGMRYPIDVAFLDARGVVVGILGGLPPNRIGRVVSGCPGGAGAALGDPRRHRHRDRRPAGVRRGRTGLTPSARGCYIVL